MKDKYIKFYAIFCIVLTIISLLVFLNYDYAITRLLRYIILINALIILAYIDYNKKIIPNKILLAMIGLRLGLMITEAFIYKDMIYSIALSSFFGMAAGGGAFLLAALIMKNSIGMGDVKLVAVIGMYVGIGDLFSCMILSLLISLVTGVILIAAKKITSKDFMPFAPFLALGTILTLILKL